MQPGLADALALDGGIAVTHVLEMTAITVLVTPELRQEHRPQHVHVAVGHGQRRESAAVLFAAHAVLLVPPHHVLDDGFADHLLVGEDVVHPSGLVPDVGRQLDRQRDGTGSAVDAPEIVVVELRTLGRGLLEVAADVFPGQRSQVETRNVVGVPILFAVAVDPPARRGRVCLIEIAASGDHPGHARPRGLDQPPGEDVELVDDLVGVEGHDEGQVHRLLAERLPQGLGGVLIGLEQEIELGLLQPPLDRADDLRRQLDAETYQRRCQRLEDLADDGYERRGELSGRFPRTVGDLLHPARRLRRGARPAELEGRLTRRLDSALDLAEGVGIAVLSGVPAVHALPRPAVQDVQQRAPVDLHGIHGEGSGALLAFELPVDVDQLMAAAVEVVRQALELVQERRLADAALPRDQRHRR